MTRPDAIYFNAIIEANKLGAKGFQIVEAIMPQSAGESYRIKFVITRPIPRSATQKDWYEE